ncbi:MAG: putative lipid II flippase FtsW [Candidatus Contendobacter odensis]|uniref:Probable peptidoglycan glycosyltransferase FtsW n=1 Tax=Candidatus Contendibacter odensensis TaxID=1400860 RepID=A0A2G6PG31_9GAMM|nr:MAG: putative lipid II flippase FtsW [Candidatus Contendobacter odensis]
MLRASTVRLATHRTPPAVGEAVFPNPWIVISALLLLTLGLLMMTSASMAIAATRMEAPFYFLNRQLLFVLIALFLAILTFHVPIARWRRIAPFLLLITVSLLTLVLFIGRDINGATRWITLGPVNWQVSEIAKLFTLIYVASYLKSYGGELRTSDFRTSALALLRPMIVLAVLAALLLFEPDFGSVVVLMAATLGMVFLAGVNLVQFGILLASTATAMIVLIVASPYRIGRVLKFLNPWDDPYGGSYQLVQSLIAIGRGELFGVGLGESVQKLFYLPEAHTDFLFAVLAEELGLIGILIVLGLFTVIVWNGFQIAQHAERLGKHFSAYLAYGIALWFGIQALFNMGVNMGVLPTKGLTLPLLSYGGSSVVVMCIALAILLRIDVESRTRGQFWE